MNLEALIILILNYAKTCKNMKNQSDNEFRSSKKMPVKAKSSQYHKYTCS